MTNIDSILGFAACFSKFAQQSAQPQPSMDPITGISKDAMQTVVSQVLNQMGIEYTLNIDLGQDRIFIVDLKVGADVQIPGLKQDVEQLIHEKFPKTYASVYIHH